MKLAKDTWNFIVALLAFSTRVIGNIVDVVLSYEKAMPSNVDAILAEARQNMPQIFRNAPEAIRLDGYPLEAHRVATQDGYVLTVHRIPRGRAARGRGRRAWRGPVFLQHGIFGGTDSWTLGGPGVAPAYFMADEGYDVWIANSRGNIYSREHVNLTDKDPAFWRFSWHEMGLYDIPAVFDYILKATGHEKLIFVAHSMGNNQFYVMLSSKPQYVQKTRLQVGIAPSVYWDNMKAPVGKFIRDKQNLIKNIMDSQNTYEILRPNAERLAFYYYLCQTNSTQRKLCASLYSATLGKSGVRDPNKLPIHLARNLQSSSVFTMLHLAQNAKSGLFCQFDYGPGNNERYYGSSKPPVYNLKNVQVPVALYTSPGDDLVPAEGVARLAQELPHVLEFYSVPKQTFNHLDFVLHDSLYDLLLHRVLNIMAKY